VSLDAVWWVLLLLLLLELDVGRETIFSLFSGWDRKKREGEWGEKAE
jgi:hypothetical protein